MLLHPSRLLPDLKVTWSLRLADLLAIFVCRGYRSVLSHRTVLVPPASRAFPRHAHCAHGKVGKEIDKSYNVSPTYSLLEFSLFSNLL